MTKKFVVLCLMLLLPITIWAQNSVTFDFSKSSSDDVVPRVMEKDGITLKLSSKPGMNSSPNYTVLKKNNFLKLDSEGILTLEGEATITSIVIIISDTRRILKDYNDDSNVPYVKYGHDTFYKQEWTGKADRVSFAAVGSLGVCINSIIVTYNKSTPILIPSVNRRTLYYGNKSFIIPKNVVARTYKIIGNVLSQSREYKEGNILPKGTAVVLEAKEGQYFFEETSEEGIVDPDNALRGSDVRTLTEGGKLYYILGNGSNGVGFYWKEENGKPFTTEAHKAYLAYSPPMASNAKSFLGFDVSLGMQTPSVSEKEMITGPIYNLAGKIVDKDYKGIIIVNGKKYFNR